MAAVRLVARVCCQQEVLEACYLPTADRNTQGASEVARVARALELRVFYEAGVNDPLHTCHLLPHHLLM